MVTHGFQGSVAVRSLYFNHMYIIYVHVTCKKNRICKCTRSCYIMLGSVVLYCAVLCLVYHEMQCNVMQCNEM